MKTSALIIAATGLALGTPSLSLAASFKPATPTAASSAAGQTTWAERWQKLENDLDKVFHDAVTKLNPGAKEKELTFSSSVDVREKPDAYVARIYRPRSDQSKINVTFANGALHISSADKEAGSYQENIAIPGPVNADKMKIEHKDGIVVVTLPKEAGSVDKVPEPTPALVPWTEGWDQQIVRSMQQMQQQMDHMTDDMLSGFSNPGSLMPPPLVGSTVNLQTEKDKYVVHFYLPDRDLSNVKVEVKNNQLHLTASEESTKETTNKGGSMEQYSNGEYSQLITLPGPVHADQMKIDRKKGTVTVTLPKA